MRPAHACTFFREILWRDTGAVDWEVFTEKLTVEVVPQLYGQMNTFHRQRDVVDYWFWKFRCDDARGLARANVILETNRLPLAPENWVTVWQRDFAFEYDRAYEWPHPLHDKEFLLRVGFVR